ncbi:MAG: ABC transporter permease [Gammaproteobacteria bacterium]|nr:ABC transporter permease [Gammaproteobacteria bacterium]
MSERHGDDHESHLSQSDTAVASFEVKPKSVVDHLQHFLHGNPTMVPVIVLILSLLVFGSLAGDKFFSPFNISLIMQQVSIIGILAAAQSLIILTAGIDLSIAATMVFASFIMGKLGVELGVPAIIAIPVGLIGGALCGWANGLMVTKIKLPPFIVTLGTWNIFYALTLYLSGAQSIRGQDIDKTAPLLKWFGNVIEIAGARISYGSVLMLVVFLVLWFVLNHTAWGRHVYAIGDDKEAAELAGVQTDKTLRQVYMVAGAICAIAAWAAIGRIGSVSPNSFYEGNLQSITAVVIGGISLFGGRGSIMGALFGALIVGVFNSGLKLIGVDVLWQLFATGWLIIIAVGLDQWIRRVSA